jgi:hypothetical protein
MRHSDLAAAAELAKLVKAVPNIGANQQPPPLEMSDGTLVTSQSAVALANLPGRPYYIVRFRDMPRLWFRQLTVEQRRELRTLTSRSLAALVSRAT